MLDDINRRLSHQFLLAFFAKPEKTAGLQRIKLKTEVPNAELVAAEKFMSRRRYRSGSGCQDSRESGVYSRVARSKFPEGEEAVAPSGKS